MDMPVRLGDKLRSAHPEGRVQLRSDAERLIDEAPAACKDIDQVMRDQADLVEVEHELHQVLNYKGV